MGTVASNPYAFGNPLGNAITLTLGQALRITAIVHSIGIDESGKIIGEAMAQPLRNKVLQFEDNTLTQIISKLPD